MRTNAQRIQSARKALRPYKPETESVETALIDLMADLYHLADKEGISMDKVRRVAFMHFAAEQGKE